MIYSQFIAFRRTQKSIVVNTGWTSWQKSPLNPGVKELCDMFERVTEHMGHDAIVIDADDLLANPGTYSRHGKTSSKYSKTLRANFSSCGQVGR